MENGLEIINFNDNEKYGIEMVKNTVLMVLHCWIVQYKYINGLVIIKITFNHEQWRWSWNNTKQRCFTLQLTIMSTIQLSVMEVVSYVSDEDSVILGDESEMESVELGEEDNLVLKDML